MCIVLRIQFFQDTNNLFCIIIMTRREKYLEKIYALFSSESIDGLTISDIAEKIGVTKMTLYNNFKDKNELVVSVINYRSLRYIEYIGRQNNKDANAIDELKRVLEFQHQNPLPMVPHLYRALQSNYPEQFKQHEERFRVSLKNFIEQNIIRGQREDIYRSDVNAEEIASYLIMTMDNMINSTVKNGLEVDLNQVHKNIIKYHIRGIANEKGLKIYDNG